MNSITYGWMDESLRHGHTYDPEIIKAIDASSLFIVFASRDYIRSDYCYKEFYEAHTKNIPIYVVNLEERIDWDKTDYGTTVRFHTQDQHVFFDDGHLLDKLNDKSLSDMYICHSDHPIKLSLHQDKPEFEMSAQLENQFTYTYKPEELKLVGREEELKQLEGFAVSPGMLQWTMIIGAAGTGKSRLCLEFATRKHSEGWNIFFYNSDLKEKLDKLSEMYFNRDTLIILDYTMSYTFDISEYLYEKWNEEKNLKYKIRVLLVDRDYGDNDDNERTEAKEQKDFLNNFQKAAYEKIEKNYPILAHHEAELYETMYRKDIPLFKMKLLSQEELVKVMRQYIRISHPTKVFNDKDANQLSERLKEIDPDNARPLLALFLAEIWAEDSTAATTEIIKALDLILSKDIEKRWIGNKGKDQYARTKAKDSMMAIVSYATVLGSVDFEDIKKNYPDQIEAIKESLCFPKDNTLKDHLMVVGLMDASMTRIQALKPDILGEYLVMKVVLTNPDTIDKLIPEGWHNMSYPRQFIANMYVDFEDECLNQAVLYNKIFLSGEKMRTMSDDSLRGYVDFITNLGQRSKNSSKQAINVLKCFYSIKSDIDSAKYISNSVCKLMWKQDLNESIDSVSFMRKLYSNHPTDEIAQGMAYALVNLSIDLDLEGREKSVDELREVYAAHQTDEVAYVMAMGLVSLTFVQNLEEREKSIAELRSVYSGHPTDEVAKQMAMGLVNLTVVQNLEEIENSIAELRDVYAAHQTDEVAKAMASGLVNLTVVQNLEGMENSIAELRKVYAAHPTDEVAEVMAQGLANLTIKRNLEGSEKSMAELRDVYAAHQTDEVAKKMAKCLCNLMIRMAIRGKNVYTLAVETKALSERHPMVVSGLIPNWLLRIFKSLNIR